MTELNQDEVKAIASTPFGRKMRKHFPMADDYINLNHASFGTQPKLIHALQRTYQEKCELAPDRYIRYELPALTGKPRQALAKLLNAPLNNIVMVPNATTGVNTVLRNIEWHPGDVIFYFSIAYGACEKTVVHLVETTPVVAHKINFMYPVSDAYLVNALRTAIHSSREKGLTPRLAMYDIVVSMPGLRFPFESITQLCRDEGVLSLIDGAHGVGHLPLDLTTLDPDFFVSNAHKWLYAPRPCAVFYVKESLQQLIRTTLPTSHGFIPIPKEGEKFRKPPIPMEDDASEFVANFGFVATSDTTPYLCVPAAIELRSRMQWNGLKGEEAVMGYCHWMANEAGKRAAEIFGTEVLSNAHCEDQAGKDSLGECCMTNVRLPLDLGKLARNWGEDAGDLGPNIVGWIGKTGLEHNTFFQTFPYGNSVWWRLSGQIYLEMGDFEQAAEILKVLCGKIGSGEALGQNKK